MPAHAVHVPMAAARSPAGNTAMMIASVLGTSSAPATPQITKPGTNAANDGVAGWLVHCSRAIEHGALEGLAICESLLRG